MERKADNHTELLNISKRLNISTVHERRSQKIHLVSYFVVVLTLWGLRNERVSDGVLTRPFFRRHHIQRRIGALRRRRWTMHFAWKRLQITHYRSIWWFWKTMRYLSNGSFTKSTQCSLQFTFKALMRLHFFKLETFVLSMCFFAQHYHCFLCARITTPIGAAHLRRNSSSSNSSIPQAYGKCHNWYT